jgi:hypothetical protein
LTLSLFHFFIAPRSGSEARRTKTSAIVARAIPRDRKHALRKFASELGAIAACLQAECSFRQMLGGIFFREGSIWMQAMCCVQCDSAGCRMDFAVA